MLNITSIENALYSWVFGVSSIETVFANPNAPRPSSQYSLINIISSTPIGISESNFTEGLLDTVDIDNSNVEEIMVSINTYYSGAYQLATLLKDSLDRITVNENLMSLGLGYSRSTTVQDMPEEINRQWEERAQFDCFFIARSIDSENLETIKYIQITNEITGESNIYPYNIMNWVDLPGQNWNDLPLQEWR